MFRSPASEQANPLPPPSRTLPANIWAQPSQPAPSSCSGSDFDLGSPLLASTRHPAMLSRRCSHLSPAHSPTEPLGPIALGTDRHRRSLAPASPLSTPFAPASLPSNFFQPWHEPPPDERIGRPTARDIRHPAGAYRDPSVGSIGSPCSSSARSGIGLSNMSPFTGNSLLPPGGPVSFGGSLTTSHLDLGYRIHSRARDSSLGAIGSGRMAARSSFGFVGSVGTDSWLTGGRSLSNDLDEDDEFAPPTKSGATSRRHSLSAFIGARSSFEPLPSSRTHPHTAFLLNDRKNNQRVPSAHSTSAADIPPQQNNPGEIFGPSSSAITDEDLCFSADFNSLNLDLDSQQSSQEPSDRLGFQFSNHYAHSQPSPFQPKPNHPPPDTLPAAAPPPPPPLNNMPWSAQLPPAPNPFGGPESFARKSSFSAGDPFSASAQASRYFAAQAGNSSTTLQDTQPPAGSRFPFSHAGSALQPLGSLSSPAVTTFSASGLLSAPPPHARQLINGDNKPAPLGPYPFDPASSGAPYYSAAATPSHPHLSTSPLSPLFHQIQQPGFPTTPNPPPPPSLVSPRSSLVPGPGPNELSELGKGVPLHLLPRSCRLYIVEFKAGRTDLFYVAGPEDPADAQPVRKDDLVIVEADRGKDLGKVVHDHISIDQVVAFQARQQELLQALPPTAAAPPPPSPAGDIGGLPSTASSRLTKEIHPKKIFGRASAADVQALHLKTEEERKALSLCRAKALQRGLRMQVKDAEWQWDRRKLTFFFVADKRIDFRELVKDLFRTWKTRIWMCSVNP
ncbi:hypothetical protein PtB15_17B290 [Puccinia triticina]|nr:hypothetical protein PtB15_17B290 [Puccinia triticina]